MTTTPSWFDGFATQRITTSGAEIFVRTGGSADKPVGTVWLAWCVNGETHSEMQHFAGDRAAVRTATVRYALQRLLGFLLG